MQCSLEMNFIDCVVSPLWEHMTHIFPKLAACNLNVRKNRAAYQALAECSNEEIAAVSWVLESDAMGILSTGQAAPASQLAGHPPASSAPGKQSVVCNECCPCAATSMSPQ